MESILYQKDKMKELLALKQKMKSKNPDFVRTDGHKIKRLKSGWRKPRGLQNKIKLGISGRGARVKIGYGTPKDVIDVERNGFKKIIVHNVKDLAKVDLKSECILIAKVGMKNKIEIVKEAMKRKIVFSNIKNPDLFLKESEEKLKKRKEIKKMAEDGLNGYSNSDCYCRCVCNRAFILSPHNCST